MKNFSELLLYSSGGISGIIINLLIFYTLQSVLKLNSTVAFTISTVCNILHNLLYHRSFIYTKLGKIPSESFTNILKISLFCLVSSIASFLFLIHILDWRIANALIITLLINSIVNILFNKAWLFVNSEISQEEYKKLSEAFYDSQCDPKQVGHFRAWYHHSRYGRLHQLIQQYWKEGLHIADVGCGNCNWNFSHLPVLGIDINENMLIHAQKEGRLQRRILSNLDHILLKDNELDIVVMSEVLEHLENPVAHLQEIYRILKPNSHLILTVPYDVPITPFFILFNLHCFYQGFFNNSSYHRNRCGHIQHFNKKKLDNVATKAGFKLERIFIVNTFLIYSVWKK